MNDYVEKKERIKFIFLKYNESLLNGLYVSDSNNNYIKDIIRLILAQMNKEEARLLTNEYIKFCSEYWWELYYSRATYYRIKKKAIYNFLNLYDSLSIGHADEY